MKSGISKKDIWKLLLLAAVLILSIILIVAALLLIVCFVFSQLGQALSSIASSFPKIKETRLHTERMCAKSCFFDCMSD